MQAWLNFMPLTKEMCSNWRLRCCCLSFSPSLFLSPPPSSPPVIVFTRKEFFTSLNRLVFAISTAKSWGVLTAIYTLPFSTLDSFEPNSIQISHTTVILLQMKLELCFEVFGEVYSTWSTHILSYKHRWTQWCNTVGGGGGILFRHPVCL